MGCWFTRHIQKSIAAPNEEPKKEYSWDKRAKINKADYTIENITDEVIGRLPGTINGQQMIIQNCTNSGIYLFDYINTITVDDCVNCNIFIGPVQGSVFLRECKSCKVIVSCQQLRTRDCSKCDIFLCCSTQPIIESSNKMQFGPYRFYYNELEGQFRKANLSMFNNKWSHIHDFTLVEGEQNFTVLPEDCSLDFPLPTTESLSSVDASLDVLRNIVPFTLNGRKKQDEDGCLVAFFPDGQARIRALAYIKDMRQSHGITLLATKEMKVSVTEAKRIFNTDHYASVLEKGNVIGLAYVGPGCISACQKTAMSIATQTGSTGLVYASSNPKYANEQLENFFNTGDLHMAG